MFPVHTILHPTDFSEHSEYAYRVACALARDYGARLVVLHVAATPVIVYGEGVAPLDAEACYAEEKEKLFRMNPGSGLYVEHRFQEGDPAVDIPRLAQESHADLIVMGTHGRTGLMRWLMGSVAEEVMRRAPCPVLTVRTPFPLTSPAAGPLAQAAPS
jgi:nucleotide-binding universal stress UspA family protein